MWQVPVHSLNRYFPSLAFGKVLLIILRCKNKYSTIFKRTSTVPRTTASTMSLEDGLENRCLSPQEQKAQSIVLEAPGTGDAGIEPVHIESSQGVHREGFGPAVRGVRRDHPEERAEGQEHRPAEGSGFRQVPFFRPFSPTLFYVYSLWRFSKKEEAQAAIVNLDGKMFRNSMFPLSVRVADDHSKQKAHMLQKQMYLLNRSKSFYYYPAVFEVQNSFDFTYLLVIALCWFFFFLNVTLFCVFYYILELVCYV